MSGASTIVQFDTIAQEAALAAEYLETGVSEELGNLLPSKLTAADSHVELHVPTGHEHWTPELEEAARQAVASQRTATGEPCELNVTFI